MSDAAENVTDSDVRVTSSPIEPAFSQNPDVIDIFNGRLTELDLQKFPPFRYIILRKNLLHFIPLIPEESRAILEEIDLYDNKVGSVGTSFTQCHAIRKIDLSYNQIRVIEGFEALLQLQELYLCENKIATIEGLDTLMRLRVLELGGNRLRILGDGLHHLISLEELWLGKNKIKDIGTAFHGLRNLKRLSLQANRLQNIPPEAFSPDVLPLLEELYLSENNLRYIENVRHLRALKLIDFSFNPIAEINVDEINPTTMPHLEEFWLTDGAVSDWTEVEKLRPLKATLQTVYLERNPIETDRRYRDKVYRTLPFLVQIDSWPIVNRNDVESDRRIHRREQSETETLPEGGIEIPPTSETTTK